MEERDSHSAAPAGTRNPAIGTADIFDTAAEQYDAWFDTPDGWQLFQNELAAIRSLWRESYQPALEVGVGTGRFAAALGVACGVDPAVGALRLARARGVEVMSARGEHLPFPDSHFGAVVMIATLCFASDAPAILREAARVLRPDGRLLVGDIPADSSRGECCLRKKAEGHRFYRYAQLYPVAAIERMIHKAGFEVEAASSTLFTPPGRTAVPERPRSGVQSGAGFVCLACRSAAATR
jgi:ubiquinone/menaquinone biosynthesis C-methylase UbiE